MTNIETIEHWLDSPNQCALITSPVSRHYLTGLESEDGTVVVTKDVTYFIIDSRYYEMAEKSVKGCEIILQKEVYGQIAEILNRHKIDTISVESDYMTISQLAAVNSKFMDCRIDTSKRLSEYLTNLRMVKSDWEIEKIVAAQRIAERAFSKLLSTMKVGMTEKQVAALLNFFMMEYGADGISFETIAASGFNSSCPHAVPTDKPIKSGEFLTLDFGAMVDGYHSDMTRTVVFGQPTEEMKNVYNAVWGANTDAMKAVRDGISAKLVDNVARATLQAWDYEEYFGHGLGHGVGLEIHEAPSLSPRSNLSLRTGMVVTIEPGVYLPGKFGVRIEDMVVVTKDGCKVLTETPKTLIYI